PFVEVLLECGVEAVLATQNPLSDAAATILARSVFSGLANGHPLDHAVARSRHYLHAIAVGAEQDATLWACPIAWSAGRLPPNLEWGDGREGVAQRQTLGRKLLPARLRSDAVSERQVPSVWTSESRIWTTAVRSTAILVDWASDVLALQRATAK